jgi:predicted kinase
MKELFLLRGLPGSGKSTLANSSTRFDHHFEADTYFIDKNGEYKFDGTKLKEAHAYCQAAVEEAMSWDQNVEQVLRSDWRSIAVSNTFTQEWEMQPYYDLAEKYGYRVYSLIVENRHGGVNEHGVPEEKLVQMKNRFDVQLLPPKEFTLEDIFNDEKKEGIKKLIKEHKDGK